MADRPNSITVLTDDQVYGDLACHGTPFLETSHTDRLYGESVRLTDFHGAPMGTPPRGQKLTGFDAARNGAVNVNERCTLPGACYVHVTRK